MAKKQDNKKKQIILAVFIVFLMSFSIMGIISRDNSSQVVRYGEYVFEKGAANNWKTKIDDTVYEFTFHPDDVEQINISQDIIGKLKNSLEIDVTSDFDDKFKDGIALAQFNMQNTLKSKIYVRQGFTTNVSVAHPIILCNNTVVPTIYFKAGDDIIVYQENNCIYAEGRSSRDFVEIADRLMYGILGIIG